MNVDAVDEHTLTRLDNVLQTLREMLADRHYKVDSIAWPSAEDVYYWSDFEKLTFALPSLLAENRWIMVFFPNEAKIGVSSVREMVSEMTDAAVDDAIFVVRIGLTSAANTELLKATASRTEQPRADASVVGRKRGRSTQPSSSRARKNVEIFTYDELQTNITLHEWVPTHTVLSKAEKAIISKRYGVRDAQFPGISVKDPVARYYGLKRGQLVFIERLSESAGSAIFYRIVRG